MTGAWSPPKEHDPDALWKLVHNRCATGGRPCTFYDRVNDIALLHSLEGRGQYLLIPAHKLAGIETAELLDAGTVNYFAKAWGFRDYVSQSYGQPIPERDLSLAINSSKGRSQNQLHIHLDCLSVPARQALDALGPGLGPQWADLPAMFDGHRYRVMYLADLNASPFRVLAAGLRHPEAEMADHTLVIAPIGQGFALIDDHAHDTDRASGEELQDHTCRIAIPSPSVVVSVASGQREVDNGPHHQTDKP